MNRISEAKNLAVVGRQIQAINVETFNGSIHRVGKDEQLATLRRSKRQVCKKVFEDDSSGVEIWEKIQVRESFKRRLDCI